MLRFTSTAQLYHHSEVGPMPRTVPTYSGTPSYVIVSFRFIDANGAKESLPILTTSARATSAAIEAMAVALAAASNANLWKLRFSGLLRGHNPSRQQLKRHVRA